MNTYSRRRLSLIPLLVARVLPLGATGCAHELAAEIPRAAIPGVVDGGLKAMDDPETQRRLAHLLASPEMKAIQRELVAGILDGSLAALGEQQRVDRVGEITARYAASLRAGFTRDVAPQLAPATSAAMRGMMSASMSDENQRQMGRMVGTLVQSSVDPIVKSLSQADFSSAASTAMTKDLGPAVRRSCATTSAPAWRRCSPTTRSKPWSGELLTALEGRFRNDEEALLRIQASRLRPAPPRRSNSLHGAH